MCRLQSSKSTVIPVNEFIALAKQHERACYIVYKGLVCNLTGFKHPGGTFLGNLNGTDATEYIDVAHETDKYVIKLIKLRSIGRLADEDALLAPEDKDLRELNRKYHEKGYFDKVGFYSLIEHIVLALASFLFYNVGWWKSGTALSFFFHLRLSYWAHDAMHHCTFSDGVFCGRAVNWITFLFFGMFSKCSFRRHAVHHVFPNVLEHDIVGHGLGPFQVDRLHAHKSPAWFMKIQPVLFYLGISCAGFGQWVKNLVAECTNWQRSLMVVRLVLSLHFLDRVTFFMPFVATSAFLYLATLNHFHMDKVQHHDERPKSFVRAMVQATCNHEGGPFWTWLSGGLNLHIEHHLFPTMAHRHFHLCQADVKALLLRHNIEYHSIPLSRVMWYNLRQLLRPHGPNMRNLKARQD